MEVCFFNDVCIFGFRQNKKVFVERSSWRRQTECVSDCSTKYFHIHTPLLTMLTTIPLGLPCLPCHRHGNVSIRMQCPGLSSTSHVVPVKRQLSAELLFHYPSVLLAVNSRGDGVARNRSSSSRHSCGNAKHANMLNEHAIPIWLRRRETRLKKTCEKTIISRDNPRFLDR